MSKSSKQTPADTMADDLTALKRVLGVMNELDHDPDHRRRVLAAMTCLRSQDCADFLLSVRGVR